jgi:hypothetical protein
MDLVVNPLAVIVRKRRFMEEQLKARHLSLSEDELST